MNDCISYNTVTKFERQQKRNLVISESDIIVHCKIFFDLNVNIL